MRTRSLKVPRVRVVIKQEDIDSAERRNSSHCMIAEAVKKCIPQAQRVAVDLQTIRWTDPNKRERYVYLTPRIGQVALVRFDQGVHSEPFSFELRNGQAIAMGVTSKARLVKDNTANNGSIPGISGGQAPPRGALSNGTSVRGARRSFGLRQLEI